METGKLRNVAKFYTHLLYTDAGVFSLVIKLKEFDTTSSSRIFIKILFQELAEFIGLAKLVERTRNDSMTEAWEGLLPRDNPRDTRFAINFFTGIGLVTWLV
jgi:pre-mRNA-splicing factor CWC22